MYRRNLKREKGDGRRKTSLQLRHSLGVAQSVERARERESASGRRGREDRVGVTERDKQKKDTKWENQNR